MENENDRKNIFSSHDGCIIMKKIVLLIIVIFVLIFGILIFQINQVWNQNDALFEKAQSTLQIELPNASILNKDIYNGKQQWIWFQVRDTNHEEKHVLIPTKKEDEQPNLVVRKITDGISKEDAIAILTEKETPKSISRVVLGIEDDRVVWEITYKNQSNQLSYYYLDFKSGEFVKSFSL